MNSRTIFVGIALAFWGVALALALPLSAFAQLNITAQNGQVFGINSVDGGVTSSAFDNYGVLALRVGSGGAVFTPDTFGLTLDGTGRRANTATPWTTSSVVNLQAPDAIANFSVTRRLDAPTGTNYIRYIDCFSNTGGTALTGLQVAWGAILGSSSIYTTTFGSLGADTETTMAATSSGDTTLTTADTWSLVTNGAGTFSPAAVSATSPAGVIFHNAGGLTSGFGDGGNGSPLGTTWTGNGNDGLSYLYNFNIAAGETAYIAHFVYTGTPNTTKATVQGELSAWNYNTAFSDLTAPDLARVLNFSGAAIPEPGTLALFIGITGALPFLRRKR
jgi:hypothetical protein